MSNVFNLGNIVLPGDNYPSIHGFNIPVTLGLEGAYLFGDGVGQMGRNYAPGKPNATVVGAPVAGAGFGTFSEAGYLNTGIAETAEMTLITVCRDSTGFADPIPGFMGNNLTVIGGGVAIYIGTTTTLRGGAGKEATTDYASVTANPAAFTAIALRAKNLAPSVVTNMNTGASASAPSSGTRTVDATNPIMIGRIPSNSFKGLNDQVAALVFSRVITDAEMGLLTTWLRGYGASKGLAF